MEQCYKNCSSPISGYAPASPCRRHIHSSFPHYFYSTPAAPPSSDSISAFVALCESRLVAEVDGDFAFVSGSVDNHRLPPAASQGKLLLPAVAPKEATTAPRPLKPPPRLQYIANIRRSLRKSIPAGLRRSSRGGGGGRRAPKPSNSGVVRNKDGADPFAAAAHKVAREEDASWCQLPWRRNGKSKVQAREAAAAAAVATKSEDGKMNDEAAAATSKNRRKGSWILRMLRSAIKGKEKEKEKEKVKVKESSSDSKEMEEEEEEEEEEEDHAKNGQLVGLVRSTTASRRRRVLVRRRTIGSSRRRH